MGYICSGGLWQSVFAVPTALTDRFLMLASPNALKLLLLILRHSDAPLSVEEMARRLRIPAQDAADAVLFWQEQGVLVFVQDAQGSDSAAEKAPDLTVPIQMTMQENLMAKVEIPATKQQMTTKVKRPKLFAHDIQRLQGENPEAAFLLQESQRLAKSTLTVLESECILSLRLYYNLPVESALLLVAHWCGKEKRSLHGLETMAAACAESGFDSAEAVGTYLQSLNRRQSQNQIVYEAFQIEGRKLNGRESEFCQKWFSLGLPPELIRFACEQTVLKTGKVSFAYADKLVSSWGEQGVRTVAQAQLEMEDNAKKAAQRRHAPKKQNKSAQTSGSSLDNQELMDFLNRDYV